MPPRRRPLVVPLLAVALLAAGCRSADRSAGGPPTADFIIAAGDSTFWVRSGPGGLRMRRSPMVLTRYGGRFYEIYVADDDRSYRDALLVGQRIYRRDIVSGDSVAVFDDPLVGRLARAYAATHPEARPLAPDDDVSEEPEATATAEAEIVDVHGPWLTFEYHTDVDFPDDSAAHLTRRGVIDLRSGAAVSVHHLFGDTAGTRLVAEGRRAFVATVDSVRAARGVRGRRAAGVIDGFAFDPASFALTTSGGRPAVAFLVPGRGERAGGYALPLPPIPATPGEWVDADSVLPVPSVGADSTADEWLGRAYDVVARYDTAGVALSVRDGGRREWTVGRLPAPALRVYRLDRPAPPGAVYRALAQAFDDASLYSEDARVVRGTGGGARFAARGARDGLGTPGASRGRPAHRAPRTAHRSPTAPRTSHHPSPRAAS